MGLEHAQKVYDTLVREQMHARRASYTDPLKTYDARDLLNPNHAARTSMLEIFTSISEDLHASMLAMQ